MNSQISLWNCKSDCPWIRTISDIEKKAFFEIFFCCLECLFGGNPYMSYFSNSDLACVVSSDLGVTLFYIMDFFRMLKNGM